MAAAACPREAIEFGIAPSGSKEQRREDTDRFGAFRTMIVLHF
jgi:hypothetical protein